MLNTKREQMEAYELLGIGGQAAELLDQLSGNPARRHEWRIEQTKKAVETAGDSGYAALVADLLGVGGRAGLTGDGTDRHPVFSGLGKGRKHASDGAAWMAAASSLLSREGHRLALTIHAGSACMEIDPEECTEECTEDGSTPPTPAVLYLNDCDLGAWLVPIIFHSLVAAAKPAAIWGTEHQLMGIEVSGTPAEWSAALNNALSASESESNPREEIE